MDDIETEGSAEKWAEISGFNLGIFPAEESVKYRSLANVGT